MIPVKALLLDVDDTLFSTTEFAKLARRNSIQAMIELGLDVAPAAALTEPTQATPQFSSNYQHHYDKLLRRLPRESLRGINPALYVAAGVVAYHETKFRQLEPFPDAREALEAIHEKTDLIIGILTEGLEIKQAEKIIRLGITPLLHPTAVFISDQVGISKPNPKLYRFALQTLGLDGPEVIYVGDNPENDIVPAHEVGMITVRYRGSGRHSSRSSPVEPDFEITNYGQLTEILRREYGLPL